MVATWEIYRDIIFGYFWMNGSHPSDEKTLTILNGDDMSKKGHIDEYSIWPYMATIISCEG